MNSHHHDDLAMMLRRCASALQAAGRADIAAAAMGLLERLGLGASPLRDVADAPAPAQQAEAPNGLPPLPAIDDYLPTDGPRWTTANFIACAQRYATDYARAALAATPAPAPLALNAVKFYSNRAATPAPAEQFRGARRRDAAEATLQRLGYEWRGGELWAPPLGKAPAWAATPAPAPFEWPKLDKCAKVGNGTFGIGVSTRFVVEAAQRQFEYAQAEERKTPEQAQQAERARRELWDMLHGAPGDATPAPAEPFGWITMWSKPGGGHEPVLSIGEAKPNYGEKLNALLTIFPIYREAATPAPAEPQGWKLVPVEPTPEMLWALFGSFVGQLTAGERKRYAAMLAAAPEAGQGKEARP